MMTIKIKNMKNIFKFNIVFLVILTLLITSCEKWIDTDMNINPDVPSNAPMELLIPTMELSMSYQVGGTRAVKSTNIYLQYLNGVDRQSLSESHYFMTASDVDDLWRRMYYQPMMDATKIISKAELEESPHYAGVAKVCMALSLGTMTNLFGDIPYSEAFMGDEAVIAPTFDTQEEVYTSIDGLLAQAIEDLGSSDNYVPLAGDIIYNNNKTSWIKAAYALRARYALYKKDYANALTYIDNSFTSSDKFEMGFGTNDAEAGPMYQFATVSSYRNDIKMCKTFIDMLNVTSDPRVSFYANIFGEDYVGSPAGSEDPDASGLGSYNNSASAPVVLSSYAEMQFIKAECLLKQASPDADGAAAAYKAAVASSLLNVTGSANTAWLDTNINTEDGNTITLEKIINQKYLAMYSTVVPFDDYRRTGYPALTTVNGAGPIPARFPYPQSELSYNPNCPIIADNNQTLWIFQ
jgi:hypothetical protein